MALLQRRQAATASEDAELQAAQDERRDAYAAYTVAEHARLAAHDPETGASYLDRLTFAAEEMRARNRLADADRRLRVADDADKRRRRELYEERVRPRTRKVIELLGQVEALQRETVEDAAEAPEQGIRLSSDWLWLPCVPESPVAESAFRVWARGISPRL